MTKIVYYKVVKGFKSKKQGWKIVATKANYKSYKSRWAWIKVYYCKMFHRNRLYGLPIAGRILTWPISCFKCLCEYEIDTPNSPQYSHNPFKPDLTQPATWHELYECQQK